MTPKHRKHHLVLFFCVSLSGLVCFSAGCTSKTPADEDKPTAHAETSEVSLITLDPAGAKTAGIVVQPVTYRSMQGALTVSGIVEVGNDHIAKVTPPVAGKIVRLLVHKGDNVRAGQPLAILDSYEIAQARAAIQEAESRVAEAEASLRTARAEGEQARTRRESAVTARTTQQRLARAGAFSEAPLQSARAELADTQSALIAAQTEQQSHAVLYERTERLFKEGIVSKSELEAAQLERQQDATRVSRAASQVESAKITLAREQKVSQGGLLNRQAVQTVEAEVRSADADAAKAGRQVEAAQTTLTSARKAHDAAWTNLRSLVGAGQAAGSGGTITLFTPFGGVVSEQQATLGEAVERTTSVFTIHNLQSVLVEAQIPEADIARVRVGKRVTVTAASFPQRQFAGTIRSLASGVDEKSRTLTARCLVANSKGLLRPEMFASVQISAGTPRRALTISQKALVAEDSKSYVFVATEKGYEKREVKVGGTVAGYCEITSGLKEGESIVTEGTYVLRSESRKGELKEE